MPKPLKRVSKTGKVSYLANPIYKGRRLGAKTFTTHREAVKYDRDMVASAERSGGVQNRLLAEAFEKYRLEVTPSRKGARWEDLRLLRLQRDPLSRIKVAALSDEHIEDWIERERKRGLADASILREFGLISSVLKYCRKWRWMAHNPMDLVLDRPKRGKHRQRRIEPWEFKAIVESLNTVRKQANNKSWQVAIAWEIAIESGMRCGEILSLSPSQINGSVASLSDTKNGDDREVPLSPRALELLAEVPDGFTITTRVCDPTFRKHRDRCKVKDLHFHDSRHEAASRFVERGIYTNPLELMKVMGWRGVDMAAVYYNPKASDFAKRLVTATEATD